MSTQCWKCDTPNPSTAKNCKQCGSAISSKTHNMNFAPQSSHNKNSATSIQIDMPDVHSNRLFGRAKIEPRTEEVIYHSNKESDLILQGLKKYYLDIMLPLEKSTKFNAFYGAPLSAQDFDTPPQVLLLGQYSVGKTSFINYLVEKHVMNSRIGPEPTTDVFTAVMHGKQERTVLGNTAVVDQSLPFRGLDHFGINFLNRFHVTYCNSPILERITFIDTPGVLSGEKQRNDRDYVFSDVIKFFAQKASMILLVFDAHKLDISDEMKEAMLALKGHENMVHCVLNKADSLTTAQLLRVYGSLMWSLGRVFTTPEAIKVFIGSFWSEQYKFNDNKDLLEREEAELLSTLRALPKNNALMQINEIVKRARLLRTHCYIIEQIQSHFGIFTNKAKKQRELLEETQLIKEFTAVKNKYDISLGDFPKMSVWRQSMEGIEIGKISDLDSDQMKKLNWVLSKGIPQLLQRVVDLEKKEQEEREEAMQAMMAARIAAHESYEQGFNGHAVGVDSSSTLSTPSSPEYSHTTNKSVYPPLPAYSPEPSTNPFDIDENSAPPAPWAIPEQQRILFTNEFQLLKLVSGKLNGQQAKPLLLQSGLPGNILHSIWGQSDLDGDGFLDLEEFILCKWLMMEANKNPNKTPPPLTLEIVPPSKRSLIKF